MHLAEIRRMSNIQKTLVCVPNVVIEGKKKEEIKGEFGVIWKTQLNNND